MDGLADWRSNPNLSEEDRRRISDMIRGVVDSDSDADTDEEEVGSMVWHHYLSALRTDPLPPLHGRIPS